VWQWKDLHASARENVEERLDERGVHGAPVVHGDVRERERRS
jgi:hypothetical protein